MQIKSFMRTLTLIHSSLTMGLIAFTLFVYFQNPSFTVGTDSKDPYVYIVPTIAILGYFLSKFLFQKQLQNIHPKDTLTTKLTRYQTASLIQYALLEGSALFALVIYYTYGNALYLVIGLSLLAYMIALRPKMNRLIKALPLKQAEEQQLKQSEYYKK
ncbi:hypothetical protein [Ulvibacterium marinum]|nr:hypothetical protein [Ulvibacterium marinum]